MISILSPAKNMRTPISKLDLILNEDITRPDLIHRTLTIKNTLKQYNPWDLESLMRINNELAVQAFIDFQGYSEEKQGTAALLTYDGLVYKNIAPEKFSKDDLLFTNKNVRILSAFYGLLRPLDGILPYRLEMQCKIKIDGETLYKFWKQEIYDELFKTDSIIINLASEEYAKCIRKYLNLSDRFIDIEFLTMKNGKLRTLATWAKMARGQMIQYITKQRIDTPERLKEFNWNGYTFEPSLSTDSKYVFLL